MIEIIPYFTVYVSSAVRFFLGPALGIGFGLGIGPTILLTTAGMMSTVFFITFFSHIIQIFIQHFFSIKKNKKFTSRTRKFIKIWKYSGVKGIAFITPIVLSPVIGALLLNAVGAKEKRNHQMDVIQCASLGLYRKCSILFLRKLMGYAHLNHRIA